MSTLLGNKQLLIDEIKSIYTSGFKLKTDLKVGLEYERLPIYEATGEAVPYSSINGICNLLRIFAKYENWDYITDGDDIIGLKQWHDTITLEPGSQLEFSLEPQRNINDIKTKVEKLDDELFPILESMGIKLLNYGVSPISTHKNISLIPKKRYKIMAKSLCGILSDVMMRETAGIQGTFDYTDEEDAIRKFKIANMLAPFLTAMYANSPIRGGVETGYKSFRALSWLNTDNDRCGFYYDMNKNFTFDDYIEYVLTTPMFFINRENNPIVINKDKNFKEFMQEGYQEYQATLDDYLLQANLSFPEVRLRNFIEVRNQDCGGGETPYSILALYKGILYSNSAITAIEDLLKGITLDDLTELRYKVPKHALDTIYKNKKLKDYAKEIIDIAETGLKSVAPDETRYLDFIKEYTFAGICPADIIIKNWNGVWNKDIRALLRFITV